MLFQANSQVSNPPDEGRTHRSHLDLVWRHRTAERHGSNHRRPQAPCNYCVTIYCVQAQATSEEKGKAVRLSCTMTTQVVDTKSLRKWSTSSDDYFKKPVQKLKTPKSSQRDHTSRNSATIHDVVDCTASDCKENAAPRGICHLPGGPT
ncbi:Aste57867_1793 [Aphanomyces stellatus]|uniref:Aste57867_1793 protein n=1 Tax=Aphanomyces stellatus TaxID=120398 RepID=A0A485KB77_9STRA|nr:hypothetical protein As57867_001791 [Aphanomyces stellatus]VFT79002.1 Aste57867_1793 [Aphanomyces stellatus]